MSEPLQGLILLGHGSRRPEHSDVLEEMARLLKLEFPGLRVELAFMSLCEPGLGSIAERLVEEGVSEITVLPCFLFRGVHVTEDIPGMLEGLKGRFPSVRLILADTLGDPTHLSRIAKERLLRAWGQRAP
jgi:sirohydrochlorin cobaltochelatase